jgi:hypothetical protein
MPIVLLFLVSINVHLWNRSRCYHGGRSEGCKLGCDMSDNRRNYATKSWVFVLWSDDVSNHIDLPNAPSTSAVTCLSR